MPDPTRPCLTCSGKLHLNRESGRAYESCGRCGLEVIDGVPTRAPNDADAVTLQRLGFRVEREDVRKAHLSRRAVAAGLPADAAESKIVEAEEKSAKKSA